MHMGNTPSIQTTNKYFFKGRNIPVVINTGLGSEDDREWRTYMVGRSRGDGMES